ncbi:MULTISPECIES: hypothetical protein [Thermoleptolyngbya]|nr:MULTISPECIES: hypothetical protein [Thermoleptolyngbya]
MDSGLKTPPHKRHRTNATAQTPPHKRRHANAAMQTWEQLASLP